MVRSAASKRVHYTEIEAATPGDLQNCPVPGAMTASVETVVTTAGGSDLRAAFLAASTWLDAHADRIDALNVFPVPDGDTGTNMSSTLRTAADALGALPPASAVGDVAAAAYKAALMGARGNSGVILSQLLRGFAHALEGKDRLGAADLAEALGEASDVAYRAVSRPVEGTILTVARVVAEAAKVAASNNDLLLLLEGVVRAADAAVAATPGQLEALRKAGVVDSGGEGYRVILEGAWMSASGRSVDAWRVGETPHSPASFDLAVADETPFGFCTELLLRDCPLPVVEVKNAMEALGESVLAVGDADLLRVHVHTLRPGQALEFAVDHGTLVKVKVENMTVQHQEIAARAQRDNLASADPQAGSIGVVAVAPGDGFQEVFRSLGATVVAGGQSMNPSIQEIVAAANSVQCEQLIVLPNNTNIILAARQAQELTPRRLEVVPTVSVPQGIGALLAFNFQANMTTNLEAMRQAAEAVHTVEITRAVRDAAVDEVQVRAGQVMGIYDGRVVVAEQSADGALLRVLEQVSTEALELLTIYYGAGVSEQEAAELAEQIRQAHPGPVVEVVRGGQEHYPYVVSLE